YLQEKKIKSIFLKVSGPFHTKFMKDAADRMERELEKINFKNADVPIYMNFSGKKTIDKEEIKNWLLKQLYNPVRWVEIIENMSKEVDCFVEIGPKNILKKLIESMTNIPTFNFENQKNLNELSQFLTKGEKNV
ncbi:MAG: malonyl CoA-acyl carrier protein transacylase, partial [bacterium]|nr:malonyl CoA-acyl carrier protein transacylase [bacterium]MDW8164533.1 malonyl CoA-acyl carrier protein transacylase [Candidatus Omnitrophota bacterium]